MNQGINDRGAKKWSKLMIPEFKDSLKQIYNLSITKSDEEVTRLKKLILFVSGKKARVAINYNPEGTVYEICGYILNYNSQSQVISVIDDYGRIKDLSLAEIEGIEIIP